MSSWTTASYVQVITRLYDIIVYLTILFFIYCFLYSLIPLFNIVHRSSWVQILKNLSNPEAKFNLSFTLEKMPCLLAKIAFSFSQNCLFF